MLLAIVFSIVVLIKNQRDKRRHNKELISKEILLRQMRQLYGKDDMEIDPATVNLNENLGEGAFGIVKKGILKPSNRPVAVKMLKCIFLLFLIIRLQCTQFINFQFTHFYVQKMLESKTSNVSKVKLR